MPRSFEFEKRVGIYVENVQVEISQIQWVGVPDPARQSLSLSLPPLLLLLV